MICRLRNIGRMYVYDPLTELSLYLNFTQMRVTLVNN